MIGLREDHQLRAQLIASIAAFLNPPQANVGAGLPAMQAHR